MKTVQLRKLSPTINVPGHGRQYKSTLVRLFNENPKLSNDRLTRVRQKKDQQGKSPLGATICLFEDFACELSDDDVTLVRVMRMRKKNPTGSYTEYRQPIEMNENAVKSVMLTVLP